MIPRWFVEETAAPTHDVHGQEMRFKFNARTYSHGWELPARLTGQGVRSGRGIPADARSKPGSGGQLIAFVPSLDLVVARQTGSSGEWAFEEFLRRACAAVLDTAREVRKPESSPSPSGAGQQTKRPEPAACRDGEAVIATALNDDELVLRSRVNGPEKQQERTSRLIHGVLRNPVVAGE